MYQPGGSPVTLYGCHAEVFLTGSEFLVNFTGTHLPGKTDEDVNEVSIANQTLTFVPQSIEAFFPNLVALVFANTQLLKISAQDLQPFPQLLMLSVFGGNITILDSDLFEFNTNVVRIYFHQNQIQNIGSDVFGNLARLYFLDISDNPCIGESLIGRNREAVLKITAQLSDLCPAVEESTCTCLQEISALRNMNAQQNSSINELKETSEDLEQRLSALEELIKTLESSF